MAAKIRILSQLEQFFAELAQSRHLILSLLLHVLLLAALGGGTVWDALQPAPQQVDGDGITAAGTRAPGGPGPVLSFVVDLPPKSARAIALPGRAVEGGERPVAPRNDSSPVQVTGNVRRFPLTLCLARYAGGDWDSTVRIENDRIVAGSLVNLTCFLRNMVSDRIDVAAEPLVVDLAGDQLFALKPPFLLFTGHRDFVLTDRELGNLQRYIRMGGVIWGDSSLPGAGSRFDIAFRREMKRVMQPVGGEKGTEGDRLEMLSPGHPIFSSGHYREIGSVPAGLQMGNDPLQAVQQGGRLAVLYSANDYADLWQFGLDARWQMDLRRDADGRYLAVNPGLWELRGNYLRGLSAENLVPAYKFGANIILYLLTQWESQMQGVPAG